MHRGGGACRRRQGCRVDARIWRQRSRPRHGPAIRAAEIRGGQKKPQLTDLRESGAIEQDADIVIFLHRPEYYGTTDANMPEGLTDVIIAKHRNGPTDEVHMRFVKREMRFADFNDQELPSDEELNVMENNIGNFDGNNGGAPVSFSSKINGNDFTTNEFPVE